MGPEGLDFGKDRLLFFTDAVFAISITLLVLEIRLPSSVDTDSASAVWHALGGLVPNMLAYVLSFVVVGSLWMNNHRRYSGLQSYDRTFMWLNLVSLLAVAFVPFPSSLISTSNTAPAVILYAATMVVIGLISATTWLYARSRRMVSDETIGNTKKELLMPLSLSIVFGASLVLLPVGIDYVRYSWVMLIPALRLSH